MAFDIFSSFVFHEAAHYHLRKNHDNRSFACCFKLEFRHENAKPNV